MNPQVCIQKALAAAVCAIIGLGVVGCSMAPEYVRPTATLPATLGQVYAPALNGASAVEALSPDEMRFVKSYGPELTGLVTQALQHNADYSTAASRVAEARSAFRFQRGQLFPTVGANASWQKLSFNNPALTERYNQDIRMVGLGVDAYELDLFARVRSMSEAARQRFLATVAAKQATRGAVLSEVLRTYTALAAAREVALAAEAAAKDAKALHHIAERQLQVGLISQEQEQRQRSESDAYEAQAEQARLAVQQAIRACQILAGFDARLPEAALADINSRTTQSVIADLPSNVLLTSPEVIAAERELQAANADIGAARAAFFPSITLSGTNGTASESLSGLFRSGSGAWTFTPSVTLPIFSFGKNKANLDLAWVRKNAAIVEYERSIESVFRAVADALGQRTALVAVHPGVLQRDQEAGLRASQAQSRVADGFQDLPELLELRLRAYETSIDRIQSDRDLALSRVDLYQALYGTTVEQRI